MLAVVAVLSTGGVSVPTWMGGGVSVDAVVLLSPIPGGVWLPA
jgi:hypothetical protein